MQRKTSITSNIKEEDGPQKKGFRSRIKSMLGGYFSDLDPTKVFETNEKLGKGSCGTVYRGKNIESGELVAIKHIELDDQNTVLDVCKEIVILSSLKHENIVNYFGSYIHFNTLWIIMEYCGSGSVSDTCQILESGLKEEQIAFICQQSLKGLKYLHSLKKVHRDIKGGNILLTDSGDVKLADFGVSAQLHTTLSRRNTFVGTPYWMAPEVIVSGEMEGAGEGYDAKADIWSLGITAIEMAEILPPRSNLHPFRVLILVQHSDPPTLADPPKWSDEFNDFLVTCLVKEVADRPTAEQLLNHPFVRDRVKENCSMVQLIEKLRNLIQKRGYRLYDDLDNDEGRFEENELSSTVVAIGRDAGESDVSDSFSNLLYGENSTENNYESGTVVGFGTVVAVPESEMKKNSFSQFLYKDESKTRNIENKENFDSSTVQIKSNEKVSSNKTVTEEQSKTDVVVLNKKTKITEQSNSISPSKLNEQSNTTNKESQENNLTTTKTIELTSPRARPHKRSFKPSDKETRETISMSRKAQPNFTTLTSKDTIRKRTSENTEINIENIFRKEATIPMPLLNLNYITPNALLFDDFDGWDQQVVEEISDSV
eukprot:TRINITY_DN2587_c0_g1_i2.p1 TRINITY_DN2587_c0_g1~~TRINITY_DN2587_c0_g1_i2.p1  ORF type:complete len:598 (-),score=240.91 TRINITY_DN2587_c0_g1_i2:120-1913(-)